MESVKVGLARENPNPNPRVVPAMAGENRKSPPPPAAAAAAAASVLERFKALRRQRDDDLRVSADDAVSAPRTEEIVQLYELVLSELTFNSKPIITDLTIVAGEQRDHAKGIAEAICARILEVSVEQKLPSLYLLDSIVKNIGREYIKHFSSRLPEVFCEAYRQVHPSQHGSMRHLFGTWTTVFPQHALAKIEAQLQFSPSVNQQPSRLPPLRASESPRQIHVNPKYVRQFEHSSAESHIQPGGNSAINLYSQKPAVGAIDRDDEMCKWQRKPSHNQNHCDTPASYKLNNGHERQGPRALIDAYGSDDRVTTSSDRPLRIERFDTNGLDHRSSTMLWQNSDEEEFNWEAMSPTLADHSRRDNFLPSSISSLRNFKSRPDLGASSGTPVESDIRNRWSTQGQLPVADESSPEDAISSLGFGRGSAGNISQFHNETNRNMVSRYSQESWNMPHHHSRPPPNLNPRGRVTNFQMPGDNAPPFIDKLPDADNQLYQPVTMGSRMGSSSIDSIHTDAPPVVPAAAGLRPPVHLNNSHPPPFRPILPMQNRKGQYDFINPGNAVKNHGPNKSFFAPGQLLDPFENKELSFTRLPQLPNQAALVGPVNLQNQMPTPSQPRLLPTQDGRGNFLPSVTAPGPPRLVNPNLDSGYVQVHASAAGVGLSNPVLPPQLNLATNNIPNSSLHLQRGGFPPLPPGPPPLQTMLPTQSAGPAVSGQHPGGAFTGLISSLMAQGLISLNKPNPVQESVGLEFNVDLLKVRHESAINALYGDLQRQCTTCGLRFKCQEEHSSHMDWHVTKNRMSKNRKQKPSRKWFVSASMWLSGAEALGTEAVPGFLPTETVVEKKSDEEMAVPADEDQKTCALCGEPFEEFYSDETEEWMYRSAAYLNAPEGSASGMDRSLLGPIVHAKCRSESSVVPPEGFGQDEGGSYEEGSQRKRLRS